MIITNLGKDNNLHKMLKIWQILPKLYRCRLFVAFHKLEPQNAGLVDVKRALHYKRSKWIFVRKIKEISIVIKNEIWSDKKLWCIKQSVLEIVLSNSLTYYQAKQIKKGVKCVQILLEIHLIHFQGRATFYTPVLATPSRHMTSKRRRTDVDAA